jgi:hypothetical protein
MRKNVLTFIVALYLASIAYAALRYVMFAPTNATSLPVFVVNKGVSMAAALCFSIAFWSQWRNGNSGESSMAVSWFRAGTFGAFAHIPMSLTILRPGYFKEFFAGERLSFNGEAVFLFGALTAGGLYLLHRTSLTPAQRWWASVATVSTLFAHTLAMGIARGLHINRSHGYLPPMWLLSLIGIGLGLAFLLLNKPKRVPLSDS